MLVLSRRPRERVLFPSLNIDVEVVRIGGNSVRLGIRAPKGVRVLREELVDQLQETVENESGDRPESVRHALRNHLQLIGLSSELADKHLRRGDVAQANAMIEQVLKHLTDADEMLSGESASQLTEPKATAQNRANGKASDRGSALLVEDNENESQLLSQLLRLHGYSVTTVNNGRAAIDQLEDGLRPDVVLLDMRMPELDGPATIAKLRRNPNLKSLPVFGVSGSEQMQAGVDVGPEGVNAWFRKPVDTRSLVRAIDRTVTDKYESATYVSGA